MEWNIPMVLLCTLLGAGLGLAGARRNRDFDIKNEAKTDGVILTEIGYVKSGIDDIKRKQDKQDEQYTKMAERVTAVEASAKQAHKRLDDLGK